MKCRVLLSILLMLAPALSRGAQIPIEVDGLTGDILTSSIPVASPGDEVIVRVLCADLFDYEYKIEETDRTELVEQIPVVGGGVVVTKATGDEGRRAAAVAAAPPMDYCDLDDFSDADLTVELLELRRDLLQLANTAEPQIAGVRRAAIDFRVKWPPAPRTAAQCQTWPTDLDTAATALAGAGLEADIEALEERQQRLETLIELASYWQTLPDAVRKQYEQKNECPPTAGADGPPKAASDLKIHSNRVKTDLQALRERFGEAHRIVTRWSEVKARRPDPIIEQKFLMDQVSRRYTVQVQRKPISDASAEVEVLDDKGKPQFATLASVSYESHARARFNFTMGLVGVDRPDDRSFAIASRLEDDASVSYRVIESESTDVELDGALFLGVYLRKRGVDPFGRDRLFDPMLMMGTEFDASPDTFYLGLGLDFKSGIVLGVGATQYQRTSLAEGWRVGQDVPAKADGSPLVATPPVVKDDDIGYYALVGFRPALFKLWWAARKN